MFVDVWGGVSDIITANWLTACYEGGEHFSDRNEDFFLLFCFFFKHFLLSLTCFGDTVIKMQNYTVEVNVDMFFGGVTFLIVYAYDHMYRCF